MVHMSKLHGQERSLGDLYQQLILFPLIANHCKANGVPHIPLSVPEDKRNTLCKQAHIGVAVTHVGGNHCRL